jgi:hypothetical protein
MMTSPTISETEIATKVIKWLDEQHWDVYQEVQFRNYGSRADIVAVRAGMIWVIECKTSMTFTVLEQADNWGCHFRSIAIPSARSLQGRGFAYKIAHKYLHLGIIEIGPSGIKQYYDPPLMREYHKTSKWMISQLREEHKTSLAAGSKGGGYFTPYRQTMNDVKRFIARTPGCTLKEIMQDLNHHYASDASAKTCIRLALESWEKNWCDAVKEGKTTYYFLKPGERL